ncbi:oleosin L-like [Salvia divinorum]|uniref:Oleosin n=1 Tax=Salvia divinorum TaxID=28513 RepID=A0ABD1GVJ1_SALDI
MAQTQTRYDHPQRQQLSHQVAKTTTAVTLGGSLMVLSGLTLTATIIGLVLATPVLVLFSPVLVPAAITVFSIMVGLVTAGGFGVVASFVFYWMYRYATGEHPVGADQIDRARDKIAHAAHDVKEKAEQYGQGGGGGQQNVKGGQGI